MRVSSHVGGECGEGYSEADGLRVYQPETDQSAPGIGSGEVGHAGCGNGTEDVCHGCCQQARWIDVFSIFDQVESFFGVDVVINANLQFGTLRMTDPPIISAIICTASPTDFSSVVLVVLKPISRMMIVENEFTTPLGIALHVLVSTVEDMSTDI